MPNSELLFTITKYFPELDMPVELTCTAINEEFFKAIHTYIIGHYNPLVGITT